MKAQLRTCHDGEVSYPTLAFVCPGCALNGSSGLHLLPVNTTVTSPSWDWDGNLEAPTISPSILTGKDSAYICHSFLKAGVFVFLGDCTHALANQSVPMPDLPDWFTHGSYAKTPENED